MTTDLRRAADWNILVAGLARVQCPYPMAFRSLATPATVGIYIAAVRLKDQFRWKYPTGDPQTAEFWLS